MSVGLVGLGLIGGSVARAYPAAGHRVLAYAADASVTGFAMLEEVVDGPTDDETLGQCGLVLIAIYPEAAIAYLRDKGPLFSKDAFVIDCCGTKRLVCETGFESAKAHGFTYVGGHPMAGTQYSGYKYSRANLFRGAPMVIVPPRYDDIALYDHIRELLAPAGFGKISVTDAAAHDRMIAFTSQLAHVVSNAYVKSPEARQHRGFSAAATGPDPGPPA
jgi:prephenate dehydrogenase